MSSNGMLKHTAYTILACGKIKRRTKKLLILQGNGNMVNCDLKTCRSLFEYASFEIGKFKINELVLFRGGFFDTYAKKYYRRVNLTKPRIILGKKILIFRKAWSIIPKCTFMYDDLFREHPYIPGSPPEAENYYRISSLVTYTCNMRSEDTWWCSLRL